MKTKQDRQKWAQGQLAYLDSVAAVKQAAETANEADGARLKSLAREIAALDEAGNHDPENLDTLQVLAAKREQLKRLEKKFAADGKQRLENAGNDIESPPGTLMDAAEGEFSEIVHAIAPFCARGAGAVGAASETGSGKCILRFRELERSFGGIGKRDFRRAVECLARGDYLANW